MEKKFVLVGDLSDEIGKVVAEDIFMGKESETTWLQELPLVRRGEILTSELLWELITKMGNRLKGVFLEDKSWEEWEKERELREIINEIGGLLSETLQTTRERMQEDRLKTKESILETLQVLIESKRINLDHFNQEGIKLIVGIINRLKDDKVYLKALTEMSEKENITLVHSLEVLFKILEFLPFLKRTNPDLFALMWFEKKENIIEYALAVLGHDLGKAVVPLEILTKETGLTKQEWEIMQMHTLFGFLLHSENRKKINLKALIALLHHPYGKKCYNEILGREFEQDYQLSEKEKMLIDLMQIFDMISGIGEERPYHIKREPVEVMYVMLEEQNKINKEFLKIILKDFLTKTKDVFQKGAVYVLPEGKLHQFEENYGFEEEDQKNRAVDLCVAVLNVDKKHKTKVEWILVKRTQLKDKKGLLLRDKKGSVQFKYEILFDRTKTGEDLRKKIETMTLWEILKNEVVLNQLKLNLDFAEDLKLVDLN